jgi:hypothetical protein
MAKAIDVLFSDFAPDRGGAPWPENPGYLVDAINVRFTPNGYRSNYLDAYVAASPVAVPATVLSAAAFANTTTPRYFAGTATKIYESDDGGNSAWNDNAGAAYSALDWEFALFGTTVIAVNSVDAPQSKALGAAVGTNFANLGGTPPVASRVARVRDSLVLGKLSSDSYGIQWSSISDPTDWPTPGGATALARQAGSVSLQSEFGVVMQIIGGEKFGLIFQERAITRMTYVGGDLVFTFDVYERLNGTGYVRSAIRIGSMIYFINSTGVFRTDGYTVESLSLGKLDDAMIAKILSYPKQPITFSPGVAYDPRAKTVFWSLEAFVDGTATDFLLGYNIALQQFKLTQLTTDLLGGTLYSVTNPSSTEIAVQLPHWLDESFKLRQLSTLSSVPTKMRTGFVELEPGAITEISGIQVIGAANSAEPVISVRSVSDTTNIDLLDTGLGAYTAAVKSPRTDRFAVRQSGRYHSFIYSEPAQAQATLIRGLRVYYEVKSSH